MTNKIIVSALALTVFSATTVWAKGEDVAVRNMKIDKKDSLVQVTFEAVIPQKAVGQDYRLTLTPVLYSTSNEQALKPIIVNGRRIQIVEERQHILSTDNAYKAKNGQTVSYVISVPYQKWMNNVSVRMERIVEGCCNVQQHTPLTLTDNAEVVTPIVPHVEPAKSIKSIAYQMGQIERRWNFTKSDMIVDYKVSKTGIEPSLFNNNETLAKLIEVVKKLYTGEYTSINKIEITGYSSPEGTRAMNSQLAIERAISLKDYLQSEVTGLPDSIFKLQNGGENWYGLRELVEASDMDYRSEVLHIIDNVSATPNYRTNTSRKKSLMELKGGRPYRYMLKEFFPKLRNACYVVVYYDRQGDVAANEMEKAVEMISNQEYAQALATLLPYKDDARSWNLIGVCYMMTEQFGEAKEYLQKAIENGDEQAKLNMREIIERE